MGDNEDPQSLHKYAYTHCDPVNGIDPSGESLVGWIIPIIGALLFVGGILLVVATKGAVWAVAIAAVILIAVIIASFEMTAGQIGANNTRRIGVKQAIKLNINSGDTNPNNGALRFKSGNLGVGSTSVLENVVKGLGDPLERFHKSCSVAGV